MLPQIATPLEVVKWYNLILVFFFPYLFSGWCGFISPSPCDGVIVLNKRTESAICPRTLWLTILAAMNALTLSWTCCKRLPLTNADNLHYPCSLRFWQKPRARRRTLVHKPSGCCLVRTLISSWARTLTTFVSRCPTRKAFTMPV